MTSNTARGDRILGSLGQPDEEVIEVTLVADGDQTILVWEERGMPLGQLAAYGAGVQIHVEDLAVYLAGGERVDDRGRGGTSFSRRTKRWRPTSARTTADPLRAAAGHTGRTATR